MFVCFEGRGRRAIKRQRQLKDHDHEICGVPAPSAYGDLLEREFNFSLPNHSLVHLKL